MLGWVGGAAHPDIERDVYGCMQMQCGIFLNFLPLGKMICSNDF